MASFKVRRQLLATGGAQIQGGTVTFGDSSSNTAFASNGRMTMTGTARVKKDIWLAPENFTTASRSAAWAGLTGNSGSWMTGSLQIDITGSILAGSSGGGMTGSMLALPVLVPEAKQTGSPITTFAIFPKPRDADTTGSVTVNIEWCNRVGAAATTGSRSMFRAGMAYFGSGSVCRTAASCGAVAASLNATAVNTFVSSCIGQLPSFGSNDTFCCFILQNRMDSALDTLGSSAIAVAGVRLTYVANALGTASTE